MTRQSITLSREELYERVWSISATKLAKELGISDVALGKICKKLAVPKPYPGYWQQLQAGRRVHKARLPDLKKGVPSVITIWPRPRGRDLKQQDPATFELIESERVPENQIVVAEDLLKAHQLVRQTRNVFERAPKDLSEQLAHWAKPHLNLRVSKLLLHRALLILDALLKGLEARGFSVEVPNEGATPTRAIIGEEKVGFFLWEKDNRSDRVYTKEELAKPSWERPDRWMFTPSGKLTFTIDEHWDDLNKRNWRDKEGKPLEAQLNDIVVGLLTAAAGMRAKRLEWEESERLRKEEAQRRREAEQRQLDEKARIMALERQAECWMKSRNLEAFLSACKDALSQQGKLDHDGPGTEWLQWATKHANNLDPLKNGKVEGAIKDLRSSSTKGWVILTLVYFASEASVNEKGLEYLERM